MNHQRHKYGYALAGKILVLEGLISAGKSTASQELMTAADAMGIKTHFFAEPLNQSLLELFLSNQKKYAFTFQMAMLIKRQAIYREAFELAKEGYFCIIDRSLYGDYCFALMHMNRGNIDPIEWGTYLDSLNSEKFEHPDYVVYLKVTPETAIIRCAARDRRGEGSYDTEYFRELCEIYDSVIPSSPANGMIILDWNKHREIEDIAPAILSAILKAHKTIIF